MIHYWSRILSKILSQFSQQFPATEVELVACTTTEVNPLIIEERADIGLMFTNLAFDVGSEPCFIGHLPFIAVCHPSHSLAKTGVAKLSDLLPHRQLMLRGDKGKVMDQFPLIAGKVWWSKQLYCYQRDGARQRYWVGILTQTPCRRGAEQTAFSGD